MSCHEISQDFSFSDFRAKHVDTTKSLTNFAECLNNLTINFEERLPQGVEIRLLLLLAALLISLQIIPDFRSLSMLLYRQVHHHFVYAVSFLTYGSSIETHICHLSPM